MIIDAHAHLFAPAALYTYRTNLVASRGQYGDFKQDVTGADFQKFADQNVAIMDGVGTDVQFLSPRPYLLMHGAQYRWDDMLAYAQANNDLIAKTVKWHPTRFRGVGTLPQLFGRPIETVFDELKRCVEELGFIGFLVNRNYIHRTVGCFPSFSESQADDQPRWRIHSVSGGPVAFKSPDVHRGWTLAQGL